MSAAPAANGNLHMISYKLEGRRKQASGGVVGGFGSGRHGGRPTVDASLTLGIDKLLRDGCLVAGGWMSGVLRWTIVGTGREIAAIGYCADLTDPAAAWMRLNFVRGDGVERCAHDCKVRLTTTRPHYGGRRWWFVCPLSERRCGKLHLPPGAGTFAARQTWRLSYASQRTAPLERARETAVNRAERIRRQLGPAGRSASRYADPPARPKGMWSATYKKRLRAIDEAEGRADELAWETAKTIFWHLKH